MELHKKITKETMSKVPIIAGLLIGTYICCSVGLQSGYVMGLLLAFIPIILICGFYFFEHPYITFFILFSFNYFVMGINRYISIPSGILIDGLFAFVFISLFIKTSYQKVEWRRSINAMTWVCLAWLLYCLLQLSNNAGETTPADWLQSGRSMAIYPLLVVILVSVLLKKYKDIQWVLIVWAIFTILAALKGYWQKNQGFDSAELAWLFSPGGGGSTHLISTGIRYFSFFTDAGNYGASMGFAMVVFLISSMYISNKWMKGLFLLAGLAGGYGMMISGTRGALAAPFAGLMLFTILSKNWKMILGGILIILLAFSFFKFTTIGESNSLIRRMRSGFSSSDASFQVRINNQNKMKTYMNDLPFGLGIGASPSTVGINNKYRIVATTATDSWLVRIWTRTGIIGLILYLLIWTFIIIYGSYIVIFRIKNHELKGVLTAMLSGTFGMMACAYGNEIYTQFPNLVLIYTCQTFVVLAPYYDKELTQKKKENIELKGEKDDKTNE